MKSLFMALSFLAGCVDDVLHITETCSTLKYYACRLMHRDKKLPDEFAHMTNVHACDSLLKPTTDDKDIISKEIKELSELSDKVNNSPSAGALWDRYTKLAFMENCGWRLFAKEKKLLDFARDVVPREEQWKIWDGNQPTLSTYYYDVSVTEEMQQNKYDEKKIKKLITINKKENEAYYNLVKFSEHKLHRLHKEITFKFLLNPSSYTISRQEIATAYEEQARIVANIKSGLGRAKHTKRYIRQGVEWKDVKLNTIRSMRAHSQFQQHPLLGCPKEIMTMIKNKFDYSTKNYTLKSDSGERLHVPNTIRPIQPVTVTYIHEDKPTDMRAVPGQQMFLNVQLWENFNKGLLRLDDDIGNTDDQYPFSREIQFRSNTFFDGINDKKLALYAETSQADYRIYALKQSTAGSGTVYHKESLKPIVIGREGKLSSVMLHPKQNQMVCGITSENFATQHLSIFDIKDQYTAKQIARIAFPFSIQKTISLGKNRLGEDSYLGLTRRGRLFTFWLTANNSIECAEQGHASQFKDIAVDNHGKQSIACLTTTGDLFVSRLLEFGQPTLLLVKTFDDHENIRGIFYDKGECGVLYNKYGGNKFERFSDNFSLLYLNAAVKKTRQKLLEQHKSRK